MPDQVIVKHYLENTSPPHNKFYEITVVARDGKYHIDLRHGRIGTDGRLMRGKHSFARRSAAESKAVQIKNNKVNSKGYVEKEVSKAKKTTKKTIKKKEEGPRTFQQVRLDRFSRLME